MSNTAGRLKPGGRTISPRQDTSLQVLVFEMRIVFTSARFDWWASAINICLLLLTFVLNKSSLMVHTTGHDALSNDFPAINVALVWVLWFPKQCNKGFWSSGMRRCVAGSVVHGDVSKVACRLYCLGFKAHKDWPSNIRNFIAIYRSWTQQQSSGTRH